MPKQKPKARKTRTRHDPRAETGRAACVRRASNEAVAGPARNTRRTARHCSW